MDIESLRKRITTHDYDESGDLSDDINKLAAMGENYRQQLTTLQAEKERLEGELGRLRDEINTYPIRQLDRGKVLAEIHRLDCLEGYMDRYTLVDELTNAINSGRLDVEEG